MWIVRLALRRPYTFVVASILILILGGFDPPHADRYFPEYQHSGGQRDLDYGGLSPEEMSNRITYNYERSLTTTVNDIEHIESQSLNGLAIVKVFFQPGVQIGSAVAQVTAISQTIAHSSGNAASVHSVQRVDCADFAAGTFGPGPDRAATR